MAGLLGQVRDLATPWAEKDVVRIMTAHAVLTRRVDELAAENRSLTDRPTAARDNVRFADRRIAALETQILDEIGVPVRH